MARKLLILLADDDKDLLEVFTTTLKTAGFEVETAADGAEAIRLADHRPHPDLIILDVHMPQMDGIEALLKLRQNPAFKTAKIVFLTSAGETNEELRKNDAKISQEIGADAYINKTEDLDEIVAKIKKLLA